MSKKVVVIFHSQTGNTEEMARAVAEGATYVPGTQVALKKAAEATLDDLLDCDVVAFGSAEYFGYMAGVLKDFFDRNLARSAGKAAGKGYAAFGSTGMGGTRALESIDLCAAAFQLTKAADGVIATGKPTPEVLQQCRDLGQKLAS
jgi:multimeric flavodoxin WrbA